MKENFKLVRIDDKYCDYLRKYDSKVMYNANRKSLRPFVGILFEVNKYKYFAPLSSPKLKHVKMKNNIDFYKIDGGKLGAINLNNMIPVMKNQIKYIDLDAKASDIQKEKYNKMLKSQIFWLNRYGTGLTKKARNLYDKYTEDGLSQNIKIRCCNYKLLEEKCEEYNK